MGNSKTIILNGFDGSFSHNGWNLRQNHVPGDAPGVKRLTLESINWNIELLPSKGFSVGQAIYKGQRIFWDAPTGLIDPNDWDPLSEDVCINGAPAKGFSFLKTFASGIELYGLKNWGMPREEIDGRLLPLHGESSNIPIDTVEVETGADKISLSVSIVYKSMLGDISTPWYLRGEPLFRIDRRVGISESSGEIVLVDRIVNISEKDLSPDWGYHITLRPEEHSKLLIPSKRIECRGSDKLPEDIDTWTSAEKEIVRNETGIIHKELKTWETSMGKLCRVLQKHESTNGVLISFTPSPYTQSWFCNGGANSKEFTYRDGKPLFEKSWNGQGIEIGSSALDHDENTDGSVSYEPSILPGAQQQIVISVKPVEEAELSEIEQEIRNYNQSKLL